MSELKEHLFCECDEVVREYRGQLSNEMRPYYLKSEADKVIADKDAKIIALDAEVFKQKHHAKLFFDERNYAEAQLRHQKYKRCLAIARWCESEAYIHEHGEDYD